MGMKPMSIIMWSNDHTPAPILTTHRNRKLVRANCSTVFQTPGSVPIRYSTGSTRLRKTGHPTTAPSSACVKRIPRERILISPNPVENGVINIVVRDGKVGTYRTQIFFNSGGIRLAGAQFSVTTTGTLVKTVQLPAGCRSGDCIF